MDVKGKSMELPKLHKVRLADQVADIMYKKIRNGELKPGDKLPSELELSEQLGVARPTVREAMSRLMGLGLVERGDYTMTVAENSRLAVRAALVPMMLDQWELRELYEARVLIECDLVTLAIRKATPDDIAELRRINEAMKDVSLTEKSYWKTDMQFHSYVAELSGNEVMIGINNVVQDLFKRYESRIEKLDTIKKITYQSHTELIDAIEKKDEQAARDIVRSTLAGSEYALYEQAGEQ